MATKLYVGGLASATTSEGLGTHFKQCGTVVSAAVITDRDTTQSRGFGFVEMSSEVEAQGAIAALDQKPLDGNNLKVNVANPRPERGPRA